MIALIFIIKQKVTNLIRKVTVNDLFCRNFGENEHRMTMSDHRGHGDNAINKNEKRLNSLVI